MTGKQNQDSPAGWNSDVAVLILRHLDGVLTAAESKELFELLEQDEAVRDQFVSMAIVEQALHDGEYGDEDLKLRAEVEKIANSISVKNDSALSPPVPNLSSNYGWISLAGIAMTLILAGAFLWLGSGSGSPDGSRVTQESSYVAAVSRSAGSDVDEHLDIRQPKLKPGDVVSFSTGVVEIKFGDRVTLVLTGPARLRVDGPNSATLFSGSVAAKVSDAGKGFALSTPDAEVVDLGTEFSVVVPPEGGTQVKVISGVVDFAAAERAKNVVRLKTGEARRVSQGQVSNLVDRTSLDEVVASLDSPDDSFTPVKDAYIIDGEWADLNQKSGNEGKEDLTAEGDLLVKRDYLTEKYNRRAIIGFDISKLQRDKILAARLVLTITTNDLPNLKSPKEHRLKADKFWKFSLSGVWNDGLDPWDEQTVTWNNAPGHDSSTSSGIVKGPNAPLEIGRFDIVGQGTSGDQVVIAGRQLVDFLKRDSDGQVTFLLSRLNGDIGRFADHTVHGFAGRDHKELPAPTLEVWLAGDSVAETK